MDENPGAPISRRNLLKGSLAASLALAAGALAADSPSGPPASGSNPAPTPPSPPSPAPRPAEGVPRVPAALLPTPRVPPGVRPPFPAKDEYQKVRPEESFAYFPNPHRGTTTFQRFNGDPLYETMRWNDRVGPVEFKPFFGTVANDRYPNTTLAYCRWVWAVLEPENGKCRWDIIEGALAAAHARGQTLQVRLQPYVEMDDVPQWYWGLGGKKLELEPDPDARRGGQRFEADQNDPLWYKHWKEFIRSFGQRFNGHPDLESVDVAYGGACGEMGGVVTPENARRLVDLYRKYLDKTCLLSMIGTPGCKYASQWPEIGWRGDCFGDLRTRNSVGIPGYLTWNHMFDEYPRCVFQEGLEETWKTAPITMETGGTVASWFRQNYDLDWILENCLKYHPTVFMPKSVYIPDQWREKIDAFDRKLGYRFVLRQVKVPIKRRPDQKLDCAVFVDNVGVAPLYRDYRLAWRFRQGATQETVLVPGELRKWLPGYRWLETETAVPGCFERGEIALDIGIVDSRTLTPKIQFANVGNLQDGWFPVTTIDLV